jgi:hypothetical protein
MPWEEFNESKDVWPFATANSSLDNCKIRYSENDVFSVEQIKDFEINPIADTTTFKPEFQISVELQNLIDETGLAIDDLQLSLVVRDRSIRRFILIKHQELQQINDTVYTVPEDIIANLSGRKGIEFVIILSPNKAGIPNYPLGSRIAQKVFYCTVPGEGTGGFPVTILDPQDPLWPQEFPHDTVWYINWRESDKIFNSDSPATDVLTVVYNKQCADRLFRMGDESDSPATLFWNEIAVEVAVEIASVYLKANGDEVPEPQFDKNGFYPKFIKVLREVFKENNVKPTLAQLRSSYNNDVIFISKLRSRMHMFYGIKEKIEKVRI